MQLDMTYDEDDKYQCNNRMGAQLQVGNIILPDYLLKKWMDKTGSNIASIKGILNRYGQENIGILLLKNSGLIDSLDVREYPVLFYKGNLSLLHTPSVAVVGTRTPTENGVKRTKKVVECLIEMGFAVMSGLAKGIDTIAHEHALKCGGKTIGVLGTPIDRIYPASNKHLAGEILKSNLMISSAMPYEQHGGYLFPRRNKLMAILSQATIAVQVGATSGVKHQAAECLRRKKKLIFLKSTTENGDASWTQGFVKSGAIVVDSSEQLKASLS